MKKIIGYLLIASPQIAITCFGIKLIGWWAMLAIYGVIAIMFGVVTLGARLAD